MIIDEGTLKVFQHYWEKPRGDQGQSVDTFFITDANWLQEAAVIDYIHYGEGLWHITLLFVSPIDSRTFIARRIRSCPTQARATMDAQFFRRTAGKDPHGTVSVNLDQFNCPIN